MRTNVDNAPAAQGHGPNSIKSEIRELAPERFWAGHLRFSPRLSIEDAAAAIETAAKRLESTFSGFLQEGDGDLKFEITRYPRRAFGPLDSIEQYEERLQNLLWEMNALEIAAIAETRPANSTPQFRVVLGLEEGYLEHEKRALVERVAFSEIHQFDALKNEALTLVASAGATEEVVRRLGEVTNNESLKEALSGMNLGRTHTLDEVFRL